MKPAERKQKLAGYAKKNRENQTPAEKQFLFLLYQVRKYLRLSKKIDFGHVFDQFIITSNSIKHAYILDFYLPRIDLVFEIDGSFHDTRKEYDDHRDRYVQSKGITTIRYTNAEVFEPGMRDKLRKTIQEWIEKYHKDNGWIRWVQPVAITKDELKELSGRCSNEIYFSHMRERHLMR